MREYIPSLTGLRFFAAFSILLNHLLINLVSKDNPILGEGLSKSGVLGMNIFFILSGFIIHWSYYDSVKYLSLRKCSMYIFARIARLYPLYIAIFLFDMFASFDRVLPDDIIHSLFFYASLSQSWFYTKMEGGQSLAVLYPNSSLSWSISTEMLMYFSFPFIAVFLRWVRVKSPLLIYILAFILIILISAIVRQLWANINYIDNIGVLLYGKSASLSSSESYSFAFWFLFTSPYVRISEFIVGVVVAHIIYIRNNDFRNRIEINVVAILSFVSFVYILLTILPELYQLNFIKGVYSYLGYIPFVSIIIYYCGMGGFSILSMKYFVWLGERSYSIYLIQLFIYGIVPISILNYPIVAAICVWTIVVFLANMTYLCIEVPGRRFFRKLLVDPILTISSNIKYTDNNLLK